jgi:very-short-patch-repair endonuclease
MAAVLAVGDASVLSHESAAALWEIRRAPQDQIEISTFASCSSRKGIVVHRRRALSATDVTHHKGIPTTTPAATLIDLAARLTSAHLEAAINEADKRDLVDSAFLSAAVEQCAPRPGTAAVRATLTRDTFTITDSELERRFLRVARKAGLPQPETQRHVSGFKVDFYWPALKLVVETDGLRYHRTPAQQATDRRRDQAHTAAGLTPLRFTYAQVCFETQHVCDTLTSVAKRNTPGDGRP